MKELNIDDEDTRKLLEIAAWNVHRFFEIEPTHAESIVSKFYLQFRELWDDDIYHEEMPYRIAARAYFVIHLGGKNSEFANWLYDSSWRDTPHEAVEYFKEHFFPTDQA